MIKPLPGYVLVEPIEEETTSAGGVYLPESTQDKPCKGRVVFRSPIIPINYNDALLLDETTWTKELEVIKVGSIVIYKKWTNQEVQHEGKTYLLVKFDELLAVIE